MKPCVHRSFLQSVDLCRTKQDLHAGDVDQITVCDRHKQGRKEYTKSRRPQAGLRVL